MKLVIKNFKGSHVGVMISFMIFVAFILFIRVILEPAILTNQDKEPMLEFIENKIINETSFYVSTTTVSLPSSISDTCLSINSFVDEFNAYPGIVIKNQNGIIIPDSISSVDSKTLYIKRNSVSENFFKIYSSDGFSVSYESVSCHAITEGTNYNSITKKGVYLFEDKIVELINDYENYENFKSALNLPNNTDAGISFEYEDGTIISTNETLPKTNIFSREKSVEYIDENANIHSGKLKTRIW